jgi:RHS repeat-associated protein
VEAYDYEPWGLLMPGRTLGSETKEGFTGKEQDAETGLSYFGARYYMAALGRWGGVDPDAEKFPHWTPYGYAVDNPMTLVDPDGRCPAFITGKPCSGAVAIAVGFIPVVGDIVDVASAVVGKDLLTGERLSAVDRIATLAGTIAGSGRAARVGLNAAVGIAGAIQDVRHAARAAEKVDDVRDATRAVERIGGDAARHTPTEPYNRRAHYGNSPTQADRKAMGAGAGEVVDHDPPLVQRYYEGDPRIGEKPGRSMTAAERRASASDRTRMRPQPKAESNAQGGTMSGYSRRMKQKYCIIDEKGEQKCIEQ